MSRKKTASTRRGYKTTRRATTVRRSSKRPASRRLKNKNRLFFPYPLWFFLILIIGVFLVIWTWNASADSYTVVAEMSPQTGR